MEEREMLQRALTGFKGRLFRTIVMTVLLGVLQIPDAAAKCGGVNYSWGADALATAHDFTVTMMQYVQYICYAVAGVVSVISGLLVYIKMQNGESDTKKDIELLVGAGLFLIGATIVFPAFFGYRT